MSERILSNLFMKLASAVGFYCFLRAFWSLIDDAERATDAAEFYFNMANESGQEVHRLQEELQAKRTPEKDA